MNRMLLLQSLMGHLALLQEKYPKKAAAPVAQRAKKYIERVRRAHWRTVVAHGEIHSAHSDLPLTWLAICVTLRSWPEGAAGAECMMEEGLPVLRHSARGCLNSIKLCVSALDLPCTFEEQFEFIDDVIRSSDRMMSLMDEIAAAFEKSAEPSQPA
jgi:hypothetical protein